MRALLAIAFLAGAAFCAFGLLATLEPMEGALAWRVGYGAALLVCLLGAWSCVSDRDAS